MNGYVASPTRNSTSPTSAVRSSPIAASVASCEADNETWQGPPWVECSRRGSVASDPSGLNGLGGSRRTHAAHPVPLAVVRPGRWPSAASPAARGRDLQRTPSATRPAWRGPRIRPLDSAGARSNVGATVSLNLPATAHADTLPLDDPEWDWKAFERFCLGFVPPNLTLMRASTGLEQAQKGIDIVANSTGGGTRTYQCRKWQSYGKGDAESTVADTTYEADEHVILVTCEVGTQVRDFIDTLPSWSILDREDLSRGVREIEPRERARRLVEDTFSVHWRRAFLGPPGPLGFWEPDDYFGALLHEGRLFRHTWEFVGRADLLESLRAKLTDGKTKVGILVGRGGIGKTRILRELSQELEQQRSVLFADDSVPLTPESVEELPWTGPLVVIDDAHRRDDLDPLLGSTRRRDDGTFLLLATRPHRVGELRAALSLVGFDPGEIWISESLSDLAESDVVSLARQALGETQAHLTERLAAATADCPLVTVVGGQLLAQRAIPPELLEGVDDFRYVVLDRFRDEMVGLIGDEVDQELARELLVLLAGLGTLSVENVTALERMAEDLKVEAFELNDCLAKLEHAGLLVARGRLRRIVPDVLGDHILHRACIDAGGRPTGRADAMLSRYGDVAIGAVLRNLAELDWRVGQIEGASTLLEPFWDEVRAAFQSGNADERLRMIQVINPVAALAPTPVIEDLVKIALEHPAAGATMDFLGYEVTDDHVRRALPPLLWSIALSPALLSESLRLLWSLGRDDKRTLPQHPDHALRKIEDLSSFELPVLYPTAVFSLVKDLMSDPEEAEGRHHSPLRLLGPLLLREGTTTRAAGYGFRMGSYNVSAAATASLRASVRDLLAGQATTGSPRNQLIAVELLGDGLAEPHGFFGSTARE